VTCYFLRERVVSPLHNPQPGGPEYMFSLAPHPRPVRHGWPYQEY